MSILKTLYKCDTCKYESYDITDFIKIELSYKSNLNTIEQKMLHFCSSQCLSQYPINGFQKKYRGML